MLACMNPGAPTGSPRLEVCMCLYVCFICGFIHRALSRFQHFRFINTCTKITRHVCWFQKNMSYIHTYIHTHVPRVAALAHTYIHTFIYVENGYHTYTHMSMYRRMHTSVNGFKYICHRHAHIQKFKLIHYTYDFTGQRCRNIFTDTHAYMHTCTYTYITAKLSKHFRWTHMHTYIRVHMHTLLELQVKGVKTFSMDKDIAPR
jgi:hypothetical protein